MGRLHSTESRQAKHDAAVLADLRRCVDDKGRLDLTAIPPGRRGRLLRHLKDAGRMRAAKARPQHEPPKGCSECGSTRSDHEVDDRLDEQVRVYGRSVTCPKCGDTLPIETGAEVTDG